MESSYNPLNTVVDELPFPIHTIELQEEKIPNDKDSITLKTSNAQGARWEAEDSKIWQATKEIEFTYQVRMDHRQLTSPSSRYHPWYEPWNFNVAWMMPTYISYYYPLWAWPQRSILNNQPHSSHSWLRDKNWSQKNQRKKVVRQEWRPKKRKTQSQQEGPLVVFLHDH